MNPLCFDKSMHTSLLAPLYPFDAIPSSSRMGVVVQVVENKLNMETNQAKAMCLNREQPNIGLCMYTTGKTTASLTNSTPCADDYIDQL
jgi:hypothetical protein